MYGNPYYTVLFTAAFLVLSTNAHGVFVAPCPDDGLALVPHESDCTKYYLCNNGQPIEQVCPEGQHFSAKLSLCTDPFTAQCENPLCPPDGLTLVPDPTDCSKFYICDNGTPLSQTCPEGQHFSETLKTCTDPDTAQCTIAVCPDEGLATVPNPSNCSLYFICIEGEAHEMTCPAGLHFSETLGTCVSENEAKCIGKFVCEPTGLETVPYPNDCTKYYICNNGDATAVTCPAGQHYSETETKCVDINSANCIGKYICLDDGMYLVPDPVSCSKYYVCNNGVAINTDCPEGLHFSAELKNCVNPDEANCNIFIKTYFGIF